jgi:hypothetical protein
MQSRVLRTIAAVYISAVVIAAFYVGQSFARSHSLSMPNRLLCGSPLVLSVVCAICLGFCFARRSRIAATIGVIVSVSFVVLTIVWFNPIAIVRSADWPFFLGAAVSVLLVGPCLILITKAGARAANSLKRTAAC